MASDSPAQDGEINGQDEKEASRGRSRSVSKSRSPSRSKSPAKLSRSPSRSRSPSHSPRSSRSRSRSPVKRSRSRSPVKRSRSRSPVKRSRSRSRSRDRRARSRSRDRRRSRSPRRRSRERRGPAEPVDLEKIDVSSDVQDAFKAAVIKLVERDRLPCNISCINDTMKQANRSWHFSKAGVNAFRQLAQWFEKQGSITLDTRDATVLLAGTKWSDGVKIIERKEDRPPPRRRSRSPPPRRGYSPRRYSPPRGRGRYSPPPRRYSPPPRRYSPPRGRYSPPPRAYSPPRYGDRERYARELSPPPFRARGGRRTPERWEMQEEDRWRG